jgi:prepilin-type N-terminal cleavage/methylation domain-containing protein
VRFPDARAGRAGDAGVSLIEVMVTMAIMSTVGVIFTGAILQLHGAANAVEAMVQAQTQVRLAFQRLDREIRYAHGITVPTTVDEAAAYPGAWYVEFLGVDTQTDAAQCSQLRLQDGQLRLRRWTPGTPPPASLAGTVLASEIDMGAFATPSTRSDPVPFERQAASSTPFASSSGAPAVGANFSPDYQRLRVRLVTRVAGEPMSSDITFAALNTTRPSEAAATGPDADTCEQDGRP